MGSNPGLFKSGVILGTFALLLAGCGGSSTAAKTSTSKSNPITTSSTPVGAPSGSNAANLEDSVVSAIQKVQAAVVEITLNTSSGSALASGSIMTSNGYILTNDHVVQGGTNIKVITSTNQTYAATVTGTDQADDLAVVKINATNLPTITFADSSKAEVGQFVIAVGNPLGVGESATFGIISALNRTVSEGSPAAYIPDAIQTSAPINPGNSGGALIDLNGQLVGIPTLGAIDTEYGNTPANGIGYAIPSDRAVNIANQIITTGSANTGRAYFGLNRQIQDDPNGGVDVTGIDPSGPAAKAGLQVGDVIVQIDNTQITDSTTFESVLATHNPGDQITVTVLRNGNKMSVKLTLGTLPAN